MHALVLLLVLLLLLIIVELAMCVVCRNLYAVNPWPGPCPTKASILQDIPEPYRADVLILNPGEINEQNVRRFCALHAMNGVVAKGSECNTSGQGVRIFPAPVDTAAVLRAVSSRSVGARSDTLILQERLLGTEYGINVAKKPDWKVHRIVAISDTTQNRVCHGHGAYNEKNGQSCPERGDFIDKSHLYTRGLEDAVGIVANHLPGFYYGRYDVMAQSDAHLSRGEFKVIEVNGSNSGFLGGAVLPDVQKQNWKKWRNWKSVFEKDRSIQTEIARHNLATGRAWTWGRHVRHFLDCQRRALQCRDLEMLYAPLG